MYFEIDLGMLSDCMKLGVIFEHALDIYNWCHNYFISLCTFFLFDSL